MAVLVERISPAPMPIESAPAGADSFHEMVAMVTSYGAELKCNTSPAENLAFGFNEFRQIAPEIPLRLPAQALQPVVVDVVAFIHSPTHSICPACATRRRRTRNTHCAHFGHFAPRSSLRTA